VSGVAQALESRWFVAGSATRLAILRIVVGLAALDYLAPHFDYYSAIAASSRSLFEPTGLARILSAPVPVDLFQVIMACMLLTNVAFILGWRFDRTGPIYAALLLWVLCYRNSWSMIYHTDNVLVIQVIILGLARSADALSVDALGGRALYALTGGRFGTRAGDDLAADRPAGPHWEYGYPIMLICAAMAVTYVLSGVAKIASPAGLAWGLGGTLRSEVAFDGLRKDLIAKGAAPMAFVLYSNMGLATVLGIGTLIVELGAPLALLGRRIGWVWAFGAFMMHWGIYVVMGIEFWYHMSGIAFLPFVLDERLIAWCRASIARGWQALLAWQARRRLGPVPTGGRPVAEPG
jgi:hypothetical protein